MTSKAWHSIILAAGLGTRMKSALPKVMHQIAGRPMAAHVAATAQQAGASRLAFVTGPDMEPLRDAMCDIRGEPSFFVQAERLGTAHAVLAARRFIAEAEGADILILYGDTPLLRAETLNRLQAALAKGAALAVLGFRAADPAGYGRLICDREGALIAIREDKEANEAEKAIDLCNSGVMAFRSNTMLSLLDQIGNDNIKGEYYLTDAAAIARADGLGVAVEICPEEEVLGVNDRAQLAIAERVMQQRLRLAAMHGGATLIAPETVTLSYDTKLGQDVIVEPNVFFGPQVTVEDNVHIKANSYMEQSIIRKGAIVGPFARLRPEADIGTDARIGNFVEVKKSVIEAGAKVNHLSYIGDARVGAKANIGAGTIICNYDGFKKHFTEIGPGAFVGSNSALVAPLKIGAGAYIGSGSVITKQVEPDSLALERSQQIGKSGWATRFREKHKKK